jgi:PAS domain S-box-containing protein
MKTKTKSSSTQSDAHSKRSARDILIGERNYASIMDSISDGVYCLNTEGYFIYVNNIILKRSGISRDKFYTSHFLDLVDPNFQEQAKTNFQRVMKGEEGIPYELRYRSFDGQSRVVEVHSRPIHDGEKIVGLLGISRDIAGRKRTETALQESELRFRLAAESCADLIWEWEIITGELKWFGPIDELLGYEVGEFPRTIDAWENIIHHDDHDRVMAKLDQHLEDGTPYHEEYRVLRRDGAILYWTDRGIAIGHAETKPSKMVGAVTDITELTLAEEARRESEEKYHAILENASDAILLADTQGNIIEANMKAEELWGYSKEELLQMHYTQLHPMPEMERAIAAFREIMEKKVDHLSGSFIQRRDGNLLPVDITGTVIEYAGKKVLQGSFRDVSQHKLTEDALERLVMERTKELSEKNKQLILEVKERRNAEAELRRKKKDLTLHAGKLQEMNAALKVLLKQRDEDKRELEEKVMANVKELILPYLEELKTSRLDAKGNVQVSILEANLSNIISPFTHRLSSQYSGFTPREIQVANLIRQGKSTKDIAEMIGVTRSAINIYRNHIRNKLGIISKKINLRSHLMSIS